MLKKKINRDMERKRQLSSAVLSRWYRPPEIILCEKEYGQAVDMWSIGCILYELIHCSSSELPQNQKKSKISSYVKDRYAF